MLPGHGRDLRQQRGAGGVTQTFFVGKQVGQNRGVIINDAVGNQPTAFLPELLFKFRLEAELAEVGIGDRAAELVVILAAIERPLDVRRKGGESIYSSRYRLRRILSYSHRARRVLFFCTYALSFSTIILWVVVFSARDTKIRCICSHSSTMRRALIFRIGLRSTAPY
jgi:hypothetical protein